VPAARKSLFTYEHHVYILGIPGSKVLGVYVCILYVRQHMRSRGDIIHSGTLDDEIGSDTKGMQDGHRYQIGYVDMWRERATAHLTAPRQEAEAGRQASLVSLLFCLSSFGHDRVAGGWMVGWR
jgi:hypothetical protein